MDLDSGGAHHKSSRLLEEALMRSKKVLKCDVKDLVKLGKLCM